MKEIRVYIQSFMLQKVADALRQIHIQGTRVSEIKGFEREKDDAHLHHSKGGVVDFVPKTRIEIICNDEEVGTIIRTIQNAASTGRKGDGEIIVLDRREAISISTEDGGAEIV